MAQQHGRKQLHIWLASEDYTFVQQSAVDNDESVSVFMRRLIRAERLKQMGGASSTSASIRGRRLDSTP
jgi:hypothetical protein